MNYKGVAEVFSQISRIYDRFVSFATAGRIHSWQREMIGWLSPKGNWLDVGTGTGEVLNKVSSVQKGICVGIDPSLEMLKVAKEKCIGSYFVQAVGEALPFREGTFSNITLSLVFRHLQDQEAFLKEACRVLDKDGRLGMIDIVRFRGTGFLLFLLRGPLRPVGRLIFGEEKWGFFIHSVENSFTPDEIKGMLERHGFRVLMEKRRLGGLIYITVASKTV